MHRFCHRSAAAALAGMLSVAVLGSQVFAEDLSGDRNGDGIVNVFDFLLEKREEILASSPATLSASGGEVYPGEDFTVTVSLDDVSVCASAEFILRCPEGIELVSENRLDECIFQSMEPALTWFGESSSLVYHTAQFGASEESGTLFTAVFHCPEDAAAGTVYHFAFDNISVLAEKDRNLPLLTRAGDVTVRKKPLTASPQGYPDYLTQGVDISAWQGDVNFSKLAADPNVDFAMIRAGYGKLASQRDKKFVQNYDGAKAAGLPVGAYWYSYALTPETAREEARACMAVLGDRTFEYPIAFDIEEPKTLALPKDEVSAIIRAFCEEMEANGYYVTVYCSSYWLGAKTNAGIQKDFDVWVAHYNVKKPTYKGKYGMWQYTSTGSAGGVSGAVDKDFCYKDYPRIIKNAKLNGLG